MGLDQYAFAVEKNEANTDFSFVGAEEGNVNEIAYWRKHPNLQGYMKEVWLRKRIAAGDPPQPETEGWFKGEIVFNCTPVRLTLEDIEELKQAIMGEALPTTTGFFYGESRPKDAKLDIAFVRAAKKAIAEGKDVYYDSWW